MRFVLIVAVLLVVLLFGCAMKPGYGVFNPNQSSSNIQSNDKVVTVVDFDSGVRLQALENNCSDAKGNGWSITYVETNLAPEYNRDGSKNTIQSIVKKCEYQHDGETTTYNYPLQECTSDGQPGLVGSGICLPKPVPIVNIRKCQDLLSGPYVNGQQEGFELKYGTITSSLPFQGYQFLPVYIDEVGYQQGYFSAGSQVGENVGYTYLRQPIQIKINIPSNIDSNGTVLSAPYDIVYQIDTLVISGTEGHGGIVDMTCERVS